MKKLIGLVMVAVISASTSASADTKFPRGTFAVAQLDKAKEEAASSKKGIAFVYTDKKTTCGLCQNAAEAYLSAVKSKTVVVFVDSKTPSNWSDLPALVRTGLTPGKFIPKLVVTDASVEKVTASLTYEQYKKDSKVAIRDLKKSMRAE